MKGPCTAMKSGPRLPQREKAPTQKRRPNTAKKKKKNLVLVHWCVHLFIQQTCTDDDYSSRPQAGPWDFRE